MAKVKFIAMHLDHFKNELWLFAVYVQLDRLTLRIASCRQIIESVMERLHHRFGLSQELPHHLSGLKARVAAKICLHNFCLWLNQQEHRPPLAIVEFLAW